MILAKYMHKKKKSLSGKLSRSVILLILSLFTITGICFGYLVYQMTYRLMMENLLSSADSYSKIIEKDLLILKEQLNGISQYAVELDSDLSSPQLNELLAKRKDEYGFVSIYGIDKNGKTSTPGVTVETRDYFLESIKGEFFISSPFLKSDNTVGITVSVPSYRDGNIDGIMSCGLPYDYFCSFVNFSNEQNNATYIVNDKGTIVAHTNSDLVMEFFNSIENSNQDASLKGQADVISDFLNGNRETHIYETNSGVKNIAVANDIPGTDGWLVITTVPYSHIIQAVGFVILVIVILVVLGVIIGALVTRKIANDIANPIQEISQRMQLLALGDLSTEIIVRDSGKDEVQLLSESIRDTITQIRSYIIEINDVVGQMAKYHLDVKMTCEFKGEFAPIKTSLNNIIDVLASSFADINNAAAQVGMSADHVADGAQSLAQGSVEQSASISELSATIAEISKQISNNASNAATANERSDEVAYKIEESNQRMKALLTAMNEINDSSGEIGRIIKTIEDIAFQTNILALNAAVEAARAGSAGKGFAVVADEVRNLAIKSSEATKSTTKLIEKSLENVDNGTKIAKNAAESINEMVVGVKEVVTSIGQISNVSEEQATNMHQIVSGMEQISSVVQTNSATAEQSSAASEELSSQANLLKELVDKFQLAKNNRNL